jgi:hypothetical protein
MAWHDSFAKACSDTSTSTHTKWKEKAKMKITKRQLRRIIKEVTFLLEEDDPDYLSLDDVGISSTDASSDDEQEMEDEDIQQLTQQRQQATDSGNSVDANAAGQKLAMLRKKHG